MCVRLVFCVAKPMLKSLVHLDLWMSLRAFVTLPHITTASFSQPNPTPSHVEIYMSQWWSIAAKLSRKTSSLPLKGWNCSLNHQLHVDKISQGVRERASLHLLRQISNSNLIQQCLEIADVHREGKARLRNWILPCTKHSLNLSSGPPT